MNVSVLLGVLALFSICHANDEQIKEIVKEFTDCFNEGVYECVKKSVKRSTVETAVKSCCETVGEKKFLPTCLCIMNEGQETLDKCTKDDNKIDLMKFAMKMQRAIQDMDFKNCASDSTPEDMPCFIYGLYETLKKILKDGGSCDEFTKRVMEGLDSICTTDDGDLKKKLCSLIRGG